MEKVAKKPRMTARTWLKENGYPEIVALIDEFINYNKLRGSGERRNYWDLLAGRQDGECFKRYNFVFPILASVRAIRKPHYKPSPLAIKKNDVEIIPTPLEQPRWAK